MGKSTSDIAMHKVASRTSIYTRGMGLLMMFAMFSATCEEMELVQSCNCAYCGYLRHVRSDDHAYECCDWSYW